jgi:SEC-C motif-containing protein
MRSRYSAFALGNAAHLLATWHSSTRPPAVELDPGQRWTGLQVLRTTGGGFLDTEGTVDFRASSTSGGRTSVLAEHSRFARDGGRWAYVGPVPTGRAGLR